MRTILGLAFAAITASSFAQLTAFWAQPWNPATGLPAWQSVIASCPNPVPARRMCFDDFKITQPTSVKSISYWGWVSNAAQLGRTFRIAIHTDNPAACRPTTTVVWQYCGVIPQRAAIGPDCTGKMVWRFNLPVPTANPLNLPPGKYWITVAEDDMLSIRPGAVPDFFWSSFQPTRLCPAIAYNWNNTVNQPLIDPCNGQRDDLAFNLYR